MKKKAIDEVIQAASAQKDPLSAFPEFRSYTNDSKLFILSQSPLYFLAR